MRVLFVSEYDARGSGYSTIASGLISEMERRGHDVTMLAFDYQGQEHPHKAAVIPSDPRTFPKQVQAAKISLKPDVVLVCYDLSAHDAFSWLQRLEMPYVGIFPVESDPLTHPSTWTNAIDTMDVALCESRFGTKLLTDAGLAAAYFPVGIDLDHWRQPLPDEREKARADWGVADRFVVLTVCDNHERKNLPAMLAAFALATGREVEWPPETLRIHKVQHPIDNGYFIINTKRRPSRIGYDVTALAETFGVQDDTLILQHELKGGMDADGLRSLYWAADAFLLLSKAEGLGLPVLEAMACGVPVVGTDCTGIGESLAEGRGFAISAEYTYVDPFGNQYRRCADVEKAAAAMAKIASEPRKYRGGDDEIGRLVCDGPIYGHDGERFGEADATVKRASYYVGEMTWAAAGEVLETALQAAVARRAI